MNERNLITMAISFFERVNSRNARRALLKENLISYMNERYPDDTFVFRSYNSGYVGGVASGIPGCLVDSEKFPGADILVRVIGKNDLDTFRDNYLHFKYEKQEFAFLKKVFDEAFNHDYKLYLYEAVASHLIHMNHISADVSFEDYMKNSSKYLRFTVVVAPDFVITDPDDFAEMLSNTCVTNHIPTWPARIYFCNTLEDYEFLPQEKAESGVYPNIHRIEYQRILTYSGNLYLAGQPIKNGGPGFVWKSSPRRAGKRIDNTNTDTNSTDDNSTEDNSTEE